MAGQWTNISVQKTRLKMEAQEAHRSHQDRLQSIVRNSSTLNQMNNRLIGLLEDLWRTTAFASSESNKEDINILFNTLEISSQVKAPSVKIEVKVVILQYLID